MIAILPVGAPPEEPLFAGSMHAASGRDARRARIARVDGMGAHRTRAAEETREQGGEEARR
jgi:hypothetical protein